MRDYLQPIGNSGFYQSPPEPVDPFDCERWPSSPYCTSTSADALGVATDLAIRDYQNLPSNVDIPGIDVGQLASDLWRGVDSWGPQNVASVGPSASFDGCEVCVTLDPTLFYVSLPPYSLCYRLPHCRDRIEPTVPRPEDLLDDDFWQPNTFGAGHYPCWYKVTTVTYDARITYDAQLNRTVTLVPRYEYTTAKGPFLGQRVRAIQAQYRSALYWGPNDRNPRVHELGGTAVGMFIAEAYRDQEVVRGSPPAVVSVERFTGELFGISQEEIQTCAERPYIQPPPQPPRDPMACCNTQEIEELLRLIAARLGVDQYPASVPESLLQSESGDAVQLQSITELFGWFIRQTDALVGQFPVDIKIQDSDPTQEGDQTVELKLPNIAEAIAEIYALAVKSSTNSDIHTSFLMRLAAEVIATKNSSIITQDYARANATFLGYKGNPKKRKIRYAFDPEGLSSLETILRESDKYVQGWQEDDPESVVNYLQKIVFSAGIIKASLFRNPRQYEQLLSEIGGLFNRTSGDESDGSWEAFIEALNDPNSRFNADAPRPQVLDPNIEV